MLLHPCWYSLVSYISVPSIIESSRKSLKASQSVISLSIVFFFRHPVYTHKLCLSTSQYAHLLSTKTFPHLMKTSLPCAETICRIPDRPNLHKVVKVFTQSAAGQLPNSPSRLFTFCFQIIVQTVLPMIGAGNP